MGHEALLKRLFPQGCFTLSDGSTLGAVVGFTADALDEIEGNANLLLSELYADTADTLLYMWEDAYGIPTDTTKPLFQRRQNLLAHINASPGGLSRAHIQAALKPYLGYDVEIAEYRVPRCDDPNTLTDYEVYAVDEDYIFEFTVNIDNSLITTEGYNINDIQRLLDEIKPAHTRALIDRGDAGFFSDDPDSLTDQTQLAK